MIFSQEDYPIDKSILFPFNSGGGQPLWVIEDMSRGTLGEVAIVVVCMI